MEYVCYIKIPYKKQIRIIGIKYYVDTIRSNWYLGNSNNVLLSKYAVF